MTDDLAMQSDTGAVGAEWTAHFRTPHLMTVRPAPGDPDTALVVEVQREDARGRIWRSRPQHGEATWSEELPFPVGYSTLPTPDGEWVVVLEDDGGSEVGGLVARSIDARERVEITPGREPYVVRGIEFAADGSQFLITAVDDDGFHLLAAPAAPWGPAREIWQSEHEGWYGRASADGTLASIDSTDHNPGWRRTAVTVIDVASGEVVAVANDLPAGPIRAVKFSPVPGDQRILVNTERSGFARPAIWSPLTGARTDFDLPELMGDVLPLDWAPAQHRVLLLHIEDGVQRLLLLDTATGIVTVLREGHGSYATPDVAAEHAYYTQSYFGGDGRVLSLEQAWDRPPSLVDIALDGEVRTAIEPAIVPEGLGFTSEMVTSADGTRVQLWSAIPDGDVQGTILIVHGGPNLVTSDAYSPDAQAWLAEGYAVAAVNFRGSVLFGRDFREGFWDGNGDREIADIRAAIERLRELGVADPASTFITGPSYGGHLTLLSLGRLPELFAGGFAFVAMADWAAAFAEMNAALRPVWERVLGNRGLSFEEACIKLSAITYTREVTGSAWLCQGARDTRTPPTQAQNYADRLRADGGDVLLEWFDAGHEPDGLAGEEVWQHRMLELAARTQRGERWSTAVAG